MTSRDRSDATTIDAYLTALASRLTVEPGERATILEEVRGHLEEAAVAEVAHGATEAEAESSAVAAFGSAATTARAFNVALPVYWDMRRMLLGIVQGALAIWIIWTLATFPFLVEMVVEHRLPNVSGVPGNLLFTASPLSFGLFYVLRDGPWAALLIVGLFGAIAFALGTRASSGRRAGLAFGLGVVVGLPFLPLAPVFLSANASSSSTLAVLVFVIPIWLLVPFAMGAAGIGARIARARDANTLRRPPTTARLTRPAATGRLGRRRVSSAVIVGLALLVALLGVNGWSLIRAAAPAPAIPASQQLANAQRRLPFTIRQPGYLPAGITLTAVTVGDAWCGRCSVSLEYRDAHGAWFSLTEMPYILPPASPTATPDSRALTPSSITAHGYRPVWWLGGDTITERQTSLAWEDGAIDFFLSTTANWSADTFRQVALSLYR